MKSCERLRIGRFLGTHTHLGQHIRYTIVVGFLVWLSTAYCSHMLDIHVLGYEIMITAINANYLLRRVCCITAY